MNKTKDWDENHADVHKNNESCWLHYITPVRIIYDLFYKGTYIYSNHASIKEYKDSVIPIELIL